MTTSRKSASRSSAQPRRSDLARSRPAAVGSGARVKREMWEREMRRVRFATRLLATVAGALLLRIAVSGLTLVTGFSLAVVVVLLIGALLLHRQGRRIEPRSSPSPQ